MLIQAPFCFFCIAQAWLSFATVIIGDPSSILLFLMHSIDLALFLNSPCCIFELCSANFMHCTVLLLTINSHYRPFKLDSSLFMHSSDLARIRNPHFCRLHLYSSVFMHCIDHPLTLNSHHCVSECFCFYAFYKSCSSQQSLLLIQAPFYYVYAFHRSACHSQQSLLRI